MIKVGLDDYAQDQLGDIVFVEMPEVGDTFKKGDVFWNRRNRVKAVFPRCLHAHRPVRLLPSMKHSKMNPSWSIQTPTARAG